MEDKLPMTLFEDIDLSVRRLTMYIVYFGKAVQEVIPSVTEATEALRNAFSTLLPLSSNPPPRDECKSELDQPRSVPSPEKPI
jgi:hypothetical protein